MEILKHAEKRTYGAIVIGSGIAGGWAAKEHCEKGLKTLVLERGRQVESSGRTVLSKSSYMPYGSNCHRP